MLEIEKDQAVALTAEENLLISISLYFRRYIRFFVELIPVTFLTL